MKNLVITTVFAAATMVLGQDLARTGGESGTVRNWPVDSISVKVFGAKGDGVADDTASIQSGLNALCGHNWSIANATGPGISPIIITTTEPNTIVNGSSLTVERVGGNTNANGRWSARVLTTTTVALYSLSGEASTGNGAYTSGGTMASATAARLYFPGGTYNIGAPLVTGCATFLSGDGPTASIIFQTHQYASSHALVANYSLRVEDVAVNTTPLTVNYGMVGVLAGSSTAVPMLGDTFTFTRFNSSGFNFGIDINGTGDTDLLASITVEDCNISVGTETNAVSQPINAANALFLTVENSTLTGNSVPGGQINNDHGIYTLAVRGVLIQNNLLRNHGNSAIKLLQGGFHSATCPTIQDYTSWTIHHNTIEGSGLAIAVYSFCALVMPSTVISNNVISNIADSYLGDYAAVYVQANCQSNMLQVLSSGNQLTDLGLGGIILASQIESDKTCADPAAQGTISNFSSVGDTFHNWSLASAGTFPAINSTGANLIHASVSQLNADGASGGNLALNLASFASADVIQ
jgi:hypothetical protein